MKILVTTPTGKIGRIIVRELLAPEFEVRVLVRKTARLAEEILDQVEVIRGSSDNAAVLSQALEGVEALFWCVPPPSLQEEHIQAHYERFARAGYRAIRDAGTRRVVTVSAIGKGIARNAGPFSGLHAMEDILNESGAVIRHLRCGSFMENFLSDAQSICEDGVISYPIAGHIPIPMVAVKDVADVALRWLVRNDWSGSKGVALHGPEDLTHNQAAAILERVLQRPVRFRHASAEEFVDRLVAAGASAAHALHLVNMFAELARGISRAEARTIESTTRTSLAAWARNELAPLIDTFGVPCDMNASEPCAV